MGAKRAASRDEGGKNIHDRKPIQAPERVGVSGLTEQLSTVDAAFAEAPE